MEGFGKGFGTGAKAMSLLTLLMVTGWVFGGVSVTRHLVQSAIFGNGTELLGWLMLDRRLYLPDLLDAFPDWKFWVLDGTAVPNPAGLLRNGLCLLVPAYLPAAKGALEGEGYQDGGMERFDR